MTTQDPMGDKINQRMLALYAGGRQRLVSVNGKNFQLGPCGLKPPSAWGLYDFNGNAREWCSDWHAPPATRSDHTIPVVDPLGPSKPDRQLAKSIRDGIFYRTSATLTVGLPDLGFRIIRTVAE